MAFSEVDARRPHGVQWLNMESMALFGEVDSVTQPNSGQRISAQHATTASPRAGSVILKNETG
jgi:hypothetical protein